MHSHTVIRALVWFFCFATVRVFAADFFVSPAGGDSGAGTLQAPFATLTRARDEVRALRAGGRLPAGPVTIWLRGGRHELATTFTLDPRDSGDAGSPVIFSGWPGEQASITGGRGLPASGFSVVKSDSPVWARLDGSARGNVLALDLRAHGVADFGTLRPRGFGLLAPAALELFADGRPMTLARWPNREAPLARTAAAPSSTRIVYSGNRPERWLQADEIWLDGFWSSTWADFHVRARGIDVGAKAIDFTHPPAQFGVEADRPYFAYNLLEELDEPGEYYIDRRTGTLYFWPPAPLGNSSLHVSMLESALVQLAGTQHVVFRDLVLETSRGALLQIEGGRDNAVQRCLLRNAGTHAVKISGANNGLDQCQILDSGDDGVLLAGGDRASLTKAGNYVTNSRIERASRIGLTYHPGINFTGGCGNIASHNLLGDMPHSAILFAGNLHQIEFNEIRRVCQMTSDAGAIYAGRDWGYRGNSVRFNFVHHLESIQAGNGVHGVYLDDGMSGTAVFGNVFYRIAGAGIFCGGGSENDMRNNLIAACEMGHYNGDYARDQFNNIPGSSWNMLERLALDGIRYQSEPWRSVFPSLAAMPSSWTEVLNGPWRSPFNCVFTNNAGWSNGNWLVETNFSNTGIFSRYASIANNNPAQPALFDESASLDRLRRAAGLRGATADFATIPFNAIGPASIQVAATLAPPVSLLTGTAASPSSTELRWSNSGSLPAGRESELSLEQRADSSGAWNTVQTFGPEADFATVSGLAPATAYAFRLKARNAAGTVYSNVAFVSTAAPPLVAGPAVRTEAESAFAVRSDSGGNGSVGASNALLDSGQNLRLFDVGDAVRIHFQVTSPGTYRIGLRVRSGDASIPVGINYWPDGYRLELDGAAIELAGDAGTVSPLDSSYGPTYWGTMFSGPVTLAAGTHAMDIAAAKTWGAVDYLELAPLTGAPSQTPPPPVEVPAPPSPAPSPLVPGRLEAEAAFAVVNDPGVHGVTVGRGTLDSGGSVGLFDVGDTIRMPFSVTAAGEYTLKVRLRSGDAGSATAFWPNGYQFNIDGVAIALQGDAASLSALDPAYGWCYWGTMTGRTARLAAGTHFLEIAAARAWAIVDFLEVSPTLAASAAFRIEAETSLFVVTNVGPLGHVQVIDAAADSGQSVSLFDAGDAVRLSFSIPAEGRFRLRVRVRAGDGSGPMAYWPEGYGFKLDGQALPLTGEAASVSPLDSSYGPVFWGTMSAEVGTLSAGTHSVEIASRRDWAAVDFIELVPATAVIATARIEVEASLTVALDTGGNGWVGVHQGALNSGGCVSLFDVGDAVRVSFSLDTARAIHLAARVRAGDGSGATAYWPGGYQFKLDGQIVSFVGDSTTISPLDSVFGPTFWGTMSADTGVLSAGAHTLEIAATRAWAAADYVDIAFLVGP